MIVVPEDGIIEIQAATAGLSKRHSERGCSQRPDHHVWRHHRLASSIDVCKCHDVGATKKSAGIANARMHQHGFVMAVPFPCPLLPSESPLTQHHERLSTRKQTRCTAVTVSSTTSKSSSPELRIAHRHSLCASTSAYH